LKMFVKDSRFEYIAIIGNYFEAFHPVPAYKATTPSTPIRSSK